jgi:hypothetical protein
MQAALDPREYRQTSFQAPLAALRVCSGYIASESMLAAQAAMNCNGHE